MEENYKALARHEAASRAQANDVGEWLGALTCHISHVVRDGVRDGEAPSGAVEDGCGNARVACGRIS